MSVSAQLVHSCHACVVWHATTLDACMHGRAPAVTASDPKGMVIKGTLINALAAMRIHTVLDTCLRGRGYRAIIMHIHKMAMLHPGW